MQQLTIDPYSECMVRGIGQTQPQVSDFLAEEPIVSLKDCRLQNSNGKCIKRSEKQPFKQSQSKQKLDRSLGQTIPQSKLHIGDALVEEEGRPQTTQHIGDALVEEEGRPQSKQHIGDALVEEEGRPQSKQHIGDALVEEEGRPQTTQHIGDAQVEEEGRPQSKLHIGDALVEEEGRPQTTQHIGDALVEEEGRPQSKLHIGDALVEEEGRPQTTQHIGDALVEEERRPQTTQHIGDALVEEEERPQTTQPYVSQLNHRPQGLNQLDHTKGDQVAAILIKGYDGREIIQKAIHKDICLVKETLEDPAILGISPENVSCIQMVQLEDIIKKTKEKELVKYVVIYYSGHFYMNEGFKIDENSFMSNKKFKELLEATKQDIILVTDCCFSGQLQFSQDNIKVQIGATGPQERTRMDHSGSIFTKILIHCLKGMKGKDESSPVTDKFPCEVCKKQKPEEVRNGPISVFSLDENIKAHMMELKEQPFETSTPFVNNSDQGDCYIL